MSDPTPDIDGWRDAQNRLIDVLGDDVTFRVLTPATYGADVALDPETGEPYDPTAVPSQEAAWADTTVKADVFNRATRGEEGDVTAAGIEATGAILVSVKCDAGVSDATRMVWQGREYKVTDTHVHGLQGPDRRVFHGEPL